MTTQATTTTSSKQYSLDIKDALRGLLVAVLSPVFTIAYTSLDAGSFTLNWKAIGTTAGAAGLGYLLKNFFTPSSTTITPAPTVPTVVTPGATTQSSTTPVN